MSFPATIPTAAIEFVLCMLLPVLLPGLGGDNAAARALAIELLAEQGPRTAHELRLAAEAIGQSLKGLAMLADSAAPDIAPAQLERSLKWATRLARAGHQAQARLDTLQRAPHAERFSPPNLDIAAAMDPDDTALTPHVDDPGSVGVTEPPPAPAPETDIGKAEATLRTAEKLLGLMKARWKGAPPPHSKAAQDIRQQRRLVDTARMALAQARRRVAALPADAMA